MMDSDLSSAVIAAIVGGVVGGLAGFFAARSQRSRNLDARKIEDRRERLRSAIEVILRFLENVDTAGRSSMASAGVPLTAIGQRGRGAIQSVLRLFPDVTTLESFFYPPEFLGEDGHVRREAVEPGQWAAVRARAWERLAVLTQELERTGDEDLRNLAQ